jgi:hypothetical protein
MLSHRGNVRTSKFWRKSKETKRNFFQNLRRAYKDMIYVKKNSKISHACVPLTERPRSFFWGHAGPGQIGSSSTPYIWWSLSLHVNKRTASWEFADFITGSISRIFVKSRSRFLVSPGLGLRSSPASPGALLYYYI